MECNAVPCPSKYTRKRKSNPETWKQHQAKISRYSPKDLPDKPECNHKTKALKCNRLSMNDLNYLHHGFYKHKNKAVQDAYLLKCCKIVDTKRKRPKNGKNKPKQFQTKYQVYSKNQKQTMQICLRAFLGIFNITKHRVQYITKKFHETGEMPTEKRGGDHRSHYYREKKEAIIKYVNMFYVDEPHYCRGNTKRFYLPSDLSINKIFKTYNAQTEEHLKVKKGYFRRIFNRNYDLGFGSPRTDVCSTCLQFSEKMKSEKDPTERNKLMVLQRVHKLKYKAFFWLLKEDIPMTKTFSFDCQKNMPLPKIPDQSTYYSRQVYLYNMTVVEGTSKSKLTDKNTFAYCWTEDEYAKGSNEIASAIYHRLNNTDWSGTKTVRLIADGCAGQNKNSIVIGMCCKWLLEAPEAVAVIELIFPVVGHSFLPPDRVFAQIEKEVRKREMLIKPEDYIDIIKTKSTVIKLGSDCQVYDWKKGIAPVMKNVGNWHFQFKKCKRYYIKRSKSIGNVVIKGDVNYKVSEGVFKKVNRKNKIIQMINPDLIMPNKIKLNQNKVADVTKLLTTHYGVSWTEVENLNFYLRIFAQDGDVAIDETLCEHREDNIELRI